MPDINTNSDDNTPNKKDQPENNKENENNPEDIERERSSNESFSEVNEGDSENDDSLEKVQEIKPSEELNENPDKYIVDANNESDPDHHNDVFDEKTEILKPLPEVKQIPKDSNYQISLISKNLLKVLISTTQGVKINSTVRDKKTSVETQNNEIYLNPKFDFSKQEVQVMISIVEDVHIADENIKNEEETGEMKSERSESGSSNYNVNLINENLLNIKIVTDKGVKIDSITRDKATQLEFQTNKIYLQPKANEQQEIQITLAIDEPKAKDDVGKFKLIPNPEVVDLIQPPSYPIYTEGDEYLGPDTGFKNPFDGLRKLIQKNLTIGIIAAVALHGVAAGVVFFNLNKKYKEPTPEEQSRIFIIQDLPDPKIKLEDVEDPNKPKVEEVPPVQPPDQEKTVRDIEPRKTVRPPKINRPRVETEDTNKPDTSLTNFNNELDSLRKLVEGISPTDSTTSPDSTVSAFDIADSLRNNFSEKDIGLAMYFPKNWKIMDQREINKNDTAFSGVLLTDTTAEQPGTMTVFIFLDKDNKDFNPENFKTEFKMNDSTLRAYTMEPKTLAGSTSYRFYIFNNLGTEKLSINAQVRKQFFDQYKNEIEAVVRSIRIKKKEDL